MYALEVVAESLTTALLEDTIELPQMGDTVEEKRQKITAEGSHDMTWEKKN